MTAGIADEPAPRRVTRQQVRFEGLRWDVVTDDVVFDDQTAARDYLRHPGAVGILALDDRDRVLLVQQYRHPVGALLWEPPAGLLDAAGESALGTAQRELAEEAGLVAATWHVLADWCNSPGGSSEGFRCFLAQDLSLTPGGRPVRPAEEADMPIAWVDLDDAVELVLGGKLGNPTAVAGILAAHAARARGWQHLRPGDTPWPTREHLLATNRVWLPHVGT